MALDTTGKQVKLIEKIEADIHKDAVTDRVDTHTADLTVTCDCSLEEFFYGSSKKVKFARNSVLADGKTKSIDQNASKEIEVKPGMLAGTVLRFRGEGNHDPGRHIGDLVITLCEQPHAKFMRSGNDLVYRHEISLGDALTSEAIEFETIDRELIKYRSESIINPKTTKLFRGKGMPIHTTDPLAPLTGSQ